MISLGSFQEADRWFIDRAEIEFRRIYVATSVTIEILIESEEVGYEYETDGLEIQWDSYKIGFARLTCFDRQDFARQLAQTNCVYRFLVGKVIPFCELAFAWQFTKVNCEHAGWS